MNTYGRQSKSSARRSRSFMDIEDKESGQATCNRITRGCLVLFSVIISLVALCLVGIGIFSPNWLILDVREYGQEWTLGLFRYCRRGGNSNEVGRLGINLNAWICDLKSFGGMRGRTDALGGASLGGGMLGRRSGNFVGGQEGFVSSDHNELAGMPPPLDVFMAAVLIFLVMAFCFGVIGLISTCIAYFNKYVPYCVMLMNLISMCCAMIGTLLFIISMQDVNARRFTSFNSVYFATMGYAVTCAVIGTILLILNFVVSIPLAVLTFAYNRHGGGAYEDYGSQRTMQSNLNTNAPVFVTSSMSKPAVQQFQQHPQQIQQHQQQRPQGDRAFFEGGFAELPLDRPASRAESRV